jgi:inorganic phosphate transporter, PiT family
MSLTAVIMICAGGLYVGANIGANDAANCIGASVGAGLVRYRTAIIAVAIFAVAGALLQGQGVTKTLGKGIVTESLPPWAVLSALLCGGIFVSIATFKKIPVSTSQSMVGAVAGVGLASSLPVAWGKTGGIIGSWIICPILTAIMTYGIYRGMRLVLRYTGQGAKVRKVLRWMVLGSAAYSAYSLGANNLGNAIGPITAMEVEIIDRTLLAVLGALSIAAGALLFGKGVAMTVGRSIIKLDLLGAFAVQMSSAFGLHFFSMLGVPVSTSQAVVGALMGMGLYHGIKAVSKRKIAEVMIGWVATPTLAGSVSYGIYRLLIFTGLG